jgi:hypothetical protein
MKDLLKPLSLYRVALTPLEDSVSAAALAILSWALVEVIAVPLADGRAPEWSAPEMRAGRSSTVRSRACAARSAAAERAAAVPAKTDRDPRRRLCRHDDRRETRTRAGRRSLDRRHARKQHECAPLHADARASCRKRHRDHTNRQALERAYAARASCAPPSAGTLKPSTSRPATASDWRTYCRRITPSSRFGSAIRSSPSSNAPTSNPMKRFAARCCRSSSPQGIRRRRTGRRAQRFCPERRRRLR